MASQIVYVAQDVVGNGAALNADVVFFHHLDKFGMFGQVETVTNPFSAEDNSIEELSVVAAVTLTSVEDELELVTEVLLSLVDDIEMLIEGRVVILLHNGVEADNHVTEAVVQSAHVDHLLQMFGTHSFQTANDDTHAEPRESYVKHGFHSLEDCQLSLDIKWTIFIEKHSENMAVLDDGDELPDVVLADLEEASLKEVRVVDTLVGQVELGLEIFPDKMILAVIKT